MRLYIRVISALLLVSVASASCSKALLSDDAEHAGAYCLIITGIVTEESSAAPIEGIRLSFHAYTQENTESPTLSSTVYTDSKGTYMIIADGFSSPVSCSISADDLQNRYESRTIGTIRVYWNGPSMTEEGIFYMNDTNITLAKIR